MKINSDLMNIFLKLENSTNTLVFCSEAEDNIIKIKRIIKIYGK
jgi:hypothetical protein